MTLVIRYNHWLPKRLKHDAVTIGQRIYVAGDQLSPYLRYHELAHTYQWKRMGPIRFLATYFWYQVKYGYARNPLEIEAHAYAKRMIQ